MSLYNELYISKVLCSNLSFLKTFFTSNTRVKQIYLCKYFDPHICTYIHIHMYSFRIPFCHQLETYYPNTYTKRKFNVYKRVKRCYSYLISHEKIFTFVFEGLHKDCPVVVCRLSPER